MSAGSTCETGCGYSRTEDVWFIVAVGSEDVYGAAIRMRGRIASAELLLDARPLAHLICSPPKAGGGGGDEASEHDDARRTPRSRGGALPQQRAIGEDPHPRRVRGRDGPPSQARRAPSPGWSV